MRIISVGIAFYERDEDYARKIAELVRRAIAQDGIEASIRVVTLNEET